MEKFEFTFDDLVEGDEERFPTIVRALPSQRAFSPKVEWINDSIVDGELKRWAEFNWCQIVRWPYSTLGVEESSTRDPREMSSTDKQTGKFLAAVEEILVNGVRSEFSYGPGSEYPLVKCCGGYRYFLGRDLEDDDQLNLKVLRNPSLYIWDTDRDGIPLDNHTFEWIAEFSLQVRGRRA